MPTFYESEQSPIASELVRQGFTLDRGEALRIIDIDERASGTDTAIAIGTAAISLVAACGTLALSGFTLPILAPIAALAFAGLTAWNSRATKQEREFEAEFLHNHPEFVEAINQKLSAGEDGDRVASAYEHTLKAFIEGDAKRMQSFLPVALVPIAMAPYPVEELPTAIASPVGNTTRLGAIEVPSTTAATSSGAAWQTPEVQSTGTPIVLNELREVCDRNNSFYIAGSKGSGKGIFVSNLLRWKLDQYPNAIALVLDPKGDVKESGYWRHERIRHFAFKGIALSSKDYAEKIVEFLSEASNLVSQADISRGMRLFIVMDELLTIKESVSSALFAEFRMFGVKAISTGDSEGIHVIAITQSFNAGDSFGSDELLKNFTQVGLFRQDEYTRAKKLTQYGRSNGELTQSEFKALISQSSVHRVMSIAGEFIPTPKSENYSAFDRDTGKIIQQMPLGSNPSEGDILAHELNRKIQTMSVSSPAESDVFSKFADTLTHESQVSLKAFVLWLETKKGSEVSYEQIKDSFARRADVGRSKEAIMPLVYAAKSKKLITFLPNSNWLVSDG